MEIQAVSSNDDMSGGLVEASICIVLSDKKLNFDNQIRQDFQNSKD